ncbi:hypothetical protein LRD18_02990 [Halorhodospira halochloris]|uniref:TolB family protein n=1 Tax=Halorhodospira halochloris TaxID=1052 RepID=UPI001EE8550B|nr:hypothetical protein [Halorhodospira halochloris]MCG5529841.1 hypothetical protein [Halorhodospira halochloris]
MNRLTTWGALVTLGLVWNVASASSTLLFVSDHEGRPSIYATDLKGSRIKRLTDAQVTDLDPVWSPAGDRIAFVSRRDESGGSVYLMRGDGTEQKRLTHSERLDFMPRWHPQGERIVFVSNRAGQRSLFEVNIATGEERQLTEEIYSPRSYRWSPEGDVLAVVAPTGEGERTEIVTIGSKGELKAVLVPASRHGGEIHNLAWHPDGTRLAYTASTENRREVRLYVYELTEKRSRRIKTPGNVSGIPSWSSDGEWIAYSSTDSPHPSESRANLYASPLDVGGEPEAVASRDGDVGQPVWARLDHGDVIVFTVHGGAGSGLFHCEFQSSGAGGCITVKEGAHIQTPRWLGVMR